MTPGGPGSSTQPFATFAGSRPFQSPVRRSRSPPGPWSERPLQAHARRSRSRGRPATPPGEPPQDAAAAPGTPLAAFGAVDAVPWGNEPLSSRDAYAAAILQARGDWLLEELRRTQVQLRELVPGARLVPAARRDPSPLTAGPAAAQIVVSSESSEGGEDSEVSEDRRGHVAVASAPKHSAPLPRMLQPSVPPPRDEMPQPSVPPHRDVLFDIAARIIADRLSLIRLTRPTRSGATEAARSLPSATQ